MKLVGATNWFVRGPFMIEGLLCGLIGSVGAIVLLLVGKAVVLPALPNWESDTSNISALAFELTALAIAPGCCSAQWDRRSRCTGSSASDRASHGRSAAGASPRLLPTSS